MPLGNNPPLSDDEEWEYAMDQVCTECGLEEDEHNNGALGHPFSMRGGEYDPTGEPDAMSAGDTKVADFFKSVDDDKDLEKTMNIGEDYGKSF